MPIICMEVCPSLARASSTATWLPMAGGAGTVNVPSSFFWIEVAAAPSNSTRVSRPRLSPFSVTVVLPCASVDPETELIAGPAVGTTVKADGRTYRSSAVVTARATGVGCETGLASTTVMR